MMKVSLVASIGLCVVLAICCSAVADNANENEYCIEFNVYNGLHTCPAWDAMHNRDGIIGYKVCFKSNYTVQDRSDGLSGPTIMCDGNNIEGDVDFQFISASAKFRLDTDLLEERTSLPKDAKNVSNGSFNVQNRTYIYSTYYTDVDRLGNAYEIGKQNGVFHTTIKEPLSLIVYTDHMSLEENIELFKSIRIIPISDKLYTRNFVLEPYNITFNFTGMEEYQLNECDGLERIESDRNSGERMAFGWEGTARLKLAKKSDTKSCIELRISKHNMINPEAIVTKARNYELIQMRPTGETISQVRLFNGRTWYSYQEKTDIERPIPTNEIHFEADLVDHYEDVEVTFEYVPDSAIDEFMNSLNITGYGTTITEETWDQYVARVRKPSEQDPGISPLEFIDRCYTSSNANIRYDKKSGDLYEIWNTGMTYINKTLMKNKIEDLAINCHYYGPIPLPKNVSIDLPNGD